MLFLASVPAPAGDIAVVIKVKGAVTYQAPDAETWSDVAAGLRLPGGSRIRTADDGLAMVKFLTDGSMMRLKPQTDLTLADTKENGPKISLGAALFDVSKQKKRGKFTVTTPTSVATVKGTRFWVTVKADSSTILACLEGTVAVKCMASGKEKDVRGGYTAVVDDDGLTVRTTADGDIPADEQALQLQLQFEGQDGTTKTLQIESTPAK